MNKKTANIIGTVIVVIGLLIIGLEVVDNLNRAENDYSMISVGLINIFLGIIIFSTSNKE